MGSALRPALTMSDIYGPAQVYVARAHPQFCDWLPNEPHVLDSLTGGQLTIAGDMPLLCSEGFNSKSGLELLALAGLKIAPNRVHFRAGEDLATLSSAAAALEGNLVFQHVHTNSPLNARCWIDPELLRFLNNKAKLPELVPPRSTPQRILVDRAHYFVEGDRAVPVVLKVVTEQSNGGGRGVMICRNASDLKSAERLFQPCAQIVVEELLGIVRNPCLNFAVMSDGEVCYLGFADQDVTAAGKYRGNWIDRSSPIPQAAVDAAMEPVRRGAALGYRGVVGVDIAMTRDDRIYVLDLNFRLNGCTAAILMAEAVAERSGATIMHFCTMRTSANAQDLAEALRPYVARSYLVPLSLFDPTAAGYASKPASVQALVLGSSREEVLAIESEIAAGGIA
jgi:hypothetical protein